MPCIVARVHPPPTRQARGCIVWLWRTVLVTIFRQIPLGIPEWVISAFTPLEADFTGSSDGACNAQIATDGDHPDSIRAVRWSSFRQQKHVTRCVPLNREINAQRGPRPKQTTLFAASS